MKGLMGDLRYSFRSLLKNPGFSTIAIITLALGIGVNATIFCVVNEYLFKPLPVNNPDNLIVIGEVSPSFELPLQLAYPNFEDLRDRTEVFSDLAATIGDPANLSTGSGQPRRVWVEYTTGNYFSMLGISPAAGRFFTPDEGAIHGAQPVVVLSYRFWQSRFGAAPSAIGQSITMNGKPLTIIGVAPESFPGTDGLLAFDVYAPAGLMERLYDFGGKVIAARDATSFSVIGRLKPGVPVERAQGAANILAKSLEQEYPKTNKGIAFLVEPELKSRPRLEVAGMTGKIAIVFMALVGLVLLIACVNVTNLMLARAAARQKEMAIRGALGASRGSMIRLLMIEGMILSAFGGLAGLVLAAWAARYLSGLTMAINVPISFGFTLDWRVFAFTFVAIVFAGLLSGLAPALRASKPALNETLKESGRGMVGGGSGQRIRSALVVAQVAVSLLLLISAGLFIRSLQKAATSDLGFRPNNLLLATMDFGVQGYDQAKGERFYMQLLDQVKALPGVKDATVSSHVPFGGQNDGADVITEDNPPAGDRVSDIVFFDSVGLNYFPTMGTRMLEGRAFTERDTAEGPRVAVVTPAMANKFWPGRSPIGKRFKTDPERPWIEVVGLAQDGKHIFVGEDIRPFFYLPLAQRYESELSLQVYTEGPPAALATPITQTIHNLDPDLPVYGVKTMQEHLDNGLAFFFVRAGAAFAGLFGALALVLATIGLYGVVSYSVTRRVHEIGVRMALGAGRRAVVSMVFREGLSLALVGVGLGLVAALAGTRLLGSMIYGVSPLDPATFVSVSILLTLIALLASYVPAMRASRVHPMAALRYE